MENTIQPNENGAKKPDNMPKVIAMIAKQLGKKPEDVTPEKRIVEDLGADSLDVVEMLMTLEETYGVTIPDDDAMNLKTVADLAGYLDKNLDK
jgi:acyl carrier protein